MGSDEILEPGEEKRKRFNISFHRIHCQQLLFTFLCVIRSFNYNDVCVGKSENVFFVIWFNQPMNCNLLLFFKACPSFVCVPFFILQHYSFGSYAGLLVVAARFFLNLSHF